jgi:hypothetical protein
VAAVKTEHEALARRVREKELLLRQCKLAGNALEEVQAGLPNLKFQVCSHNKYLQLKPSRASELN